MKVLVTGATGFIGRELIKKLNANGHEILVLTRNSDSAKFRIPVHCEIVTWDPEKHSLSPSVLKGVDAVINLGIKNDNEGLDFFLSDADTNFQSIQNLFKESYIIKKMKFLGRW